MPWIRRLVAGLLMGLAGMTCSQAAEIALACSGLGREFEICKQGAEIWAGKTGNTVKLVSTPNSATERLALYQQLLAAGASDIDVFQIDAVWPGILGQHFIDLAPLLGNATADHFPSIIANNTVGGRLVGMPWFVDAGLLYFRKDLLERYNRPVPQTWADLTETARIIQDGERQAGRRDFWGFVWQGKAYEGLTCNAIEWVSAYGGGTIVDKDGAITINNPRAVQALRTAAGWVGTISPPGVLNYEEEEARGVFQSGNAVFMRNWPFAWALAQGDDSPVKGKVGVAPLPKGGADGRNAGALGGQQLAVSKYSKNQALAVDLVRYLTSPEEQKRRAVVGSFNPTIRTLFQDPDVVRAAPFIGELFQVFANAVPRPAAVTGEDYNKVSSAFFNAVHSVLANQSGPDQALASLDQELKRIKRRGWPQ